MDDDDDDDITNCCKCRRLITDPTTLPCLDSLCAKCFKELRDAYRDNSEGVAKCPRCADQFHLPTNDSEALPDHGFVDTLVALKKIASQNVEDNNCDICKQLAASTEPVAAVEYCIECRQRLCASCARRHPLCFSTKNHNLVDLGVDSAKEVSAMMRSFFPGCANHKDIHATVHCYQCSISLCSLCQNSHSSHELEVLTDDTHGQLTDSVKSLTDNLRQQLDECKVKEDRIQKLLSDRRNGVVLVEKEISDKADEMISLIQKHRNDLLNKLHSRNDQTISTLETVSGNVSSGLSAKKQALRFAEELFEKGSVEDMLLNYRMLNARVARLHDMSDGSSELDDNVCSDVSAASLIRDMCSSLNSQSKWYSFPSCLLSCGCRPLSHFLPLYSG